MIRWFSVSILMASAMHLVWAVGLIADRSSANATGLHAIMLIAGNHVVAAAILVVVAVLATFAAFLDPVNRALRTMMMLPQQCVLVISTVGVFEAMASRSFADGVPRPFWFIVADQVPLATIAMGYVVTLTRVAAGVDWRPR